MDNHNKLFTLSRAILEAQAKIDRATSVSSHFLNPSISDLARQAFDRQNSPSKTSFSALFGTTSLAKLAMESNPRNHSIIYGTSSPTLLAFMQAEKSVDHINKLLGNSLASMMFEKQRNIYARLGMHLSGEDTLLGSKWKNVISSSKLYDKSSSSLFDALSTISLTSALRTETNNSHELSIQESFEEVDDLLNDKDIEIEVNNVLKTIQKRIRRKNPKANIEDFNDVIKIDKIIAHFLHNVLFRRVGLSPQASTNLTWCLITITTFLVNYYASSGLDSWSNNEKSSKPIKEINHNHVHNCFLGTSVGFARINCPVYLRNSIKTKCLGTLAEGTTVEILSEKPEWVFIRAMLQGRRNKSNGSTDFLSQGWIKKTYLLDN